MYTEQELRQRREKFAAMAMQGAMANPAFTTASVESIACMCVAQAEALIQELNGGAAPEVPDED